MPELTLADRVGQMTVLLSQVAEAAVQLEGYQARFEAERKSGVLGEAQMSVDGCKQTLRAALDALDEHLATLREMAS